MEGSGQQGALKSAWPWAVGFSGDVGLALSSVCQDKNQGFQSWQSLAVSHPALILQVGS